MTAVADVVGAVGVVGAIGEAAGAVPEGETAIGEMPAGAVPAGELRAGDLGAVPTERLEAEATTLAGHIAAATARFLDVVAELDRREAWRSWEARSTAHWVSWQCGLGMRAAQEHVRVAVALRDLPLARAAFARGELSFSKVRALTRFATPAQERDDVELARAATAAQLERIAGAYRAACRAAGPDPTRRALDASFVTTETDADEATTTITLRVPNDVAVRFRAALDRALESVPHDAAVPAVHRRVLGFAALVDGWCEPDPDRAAVEVSVHVDVETLAVDAPGRCDADGTRIPAETARRLACDCGVRVAGRLDGRLDGGIDGRLDGTALDLGRRARFPNPALRRAVLADAGGGCRFPGCTQRSRLRIHHARHWARGGATDRHNLVALCPAHHRAVHEGGWHVAADGHGAFEFCDPGGRTVPPVVRPAPVRAGALVAANRARGVTIGPATTVSLANGERMDLDWTMTVVCANHGVAREPRAGRSAERSGEWTVVVPPPDDDRTDADRADEAGADDADALL